MLLKESPVHKLSGIGPGQVNDRKHGRHQYGQRRRGHKRLADIRWNPRSHTVL